MRKKSVTRLAIAAGASALVLLVVACTDGAREVVKAGAERSSNERTLDPALNNLDGVTQHG